MHLLEAIKPLGDKTGLIVMDIDNSILIPDPDVIGITKIKDGKKQWLSCYEYDHDPDLESGNLDVEWDFSEFRDPLKVKYSILQGTPLVGNLKLMDAHLRAGYDFAFLTARGCEDVIDEALDGFLKFRGDDGELDHLYSKFHKGLSAAVNDEKYMKVFEGLDSAQRKAEVLKSFCKRYDRVVFVDDSDKNVDEARALNLPNLKVVKAQTK